MGYRIPIKEWYIDGSRPLNDAIIYRKSDIDNYLERIGKGETFYYGATDSWLYKALKCHPIHRHNVAVIGSETPIYESMIIFYGGKPTTIEYNKIISDDDRLTILRVNEAKIHAHEFDSAFSISSFEHDGLGRYGDPLNPDGDIDAMANTKTLIKDKGILFLSIPIGPDTLVWNAHRIYGPLRLPKLLSGWKLIDTFPSMFQWIFFRGQIQPMLVLQNFTDNVSIKRFIKKFRIVLFLRRNFRIISNIIK